MKKNGIITDNMQNTDIHLTPDWRQAIIDEALTILWAIVFLIIGGTNIQFHSIFFCLGLALIFKTYYTLVRTRCTEFVITDQQLIYIRGIFTVTKDYIELYRIMDYDEQRSLLQQFVGLKSLSIHSGDRTTPVLKINGVKENIDLVRILRDRVTYNRSRMNIHEFANYI